LGALPGQHPAPAAAEQHRAPDGQQNSVPAQHVGKVLLQQAALFVQQILPGWQQLPLGKTPPTAQHS
jgi:hypothetical protein